MDKLYEKTLLHQSRNMNVVKVGVVLDNATDSQLPQFITLDQTQPIEVAVRELNQKWKQPDPENYTLKLDEKDNKEFITEANRSNIKAGYVLRMSLTPAKTVAYILEKMHSKLDDERLSTMMKLAPLCSDSTFVQEFINADGHLELIREIEKEKHTEALANSVKAFTELMDQGIVSWDILEPRFIQCIGSLVDPQISKNHNPVSLQSCLEILENVLLNASGPGTYAVVEQSVTPANLIPHLQSNNLEVKKGALAVINALLSKADSAKRKKIAENLQSKSMRSIVLNFVVSDTKRVSDEMAHQLHVLQRLLLNLMEDRRRTPVDVNDQAFIKYINEIKRIAFDSETDTSAIKRPPHNQDFKKLGFQNYDSPIHDFTKTPPGVLALDNIMHFARCHNSNFSKLVLENSCRADEYDLPFVRASIELTEMLCNILDMGKPPSDDGIVYYKMFFGHDKPFEEFYCICVQLLNKTWKEMKATSADFTKVLNVVQEQITRTLTDRRPCDSYDQFKGLLNDYTYPKISEMWLKERKMKEEGESQAPPIVELREQLKPEIVELIKKQRLNYLMAGTRFPRLAKGKQNKDKSFYCKLSPNGKVFYFGDWEESTVPMLEQLGNKLPIAEIKGLVTGKDCPHVKEKKQKGSFPVGLAFSILTEQEANPSLNFVAPSEDDYHMWTDGINALLGHTMTSPLRDEHLKMLLNMEVKLCLLDIEGIKLPEKPPTIPPDPPNYNFASDM